MLERNKPATAVQLKTCIVLSATRTVEYDSKRL